MQLEELYDYKNKLMEDLVTDKNMVKLIDDNIPFQQSTKLIYSSIFPYEFIPETIEVGKTFVCFEVEVQSVSSSTYLNPVILIWVFSHKSKARLPEGGVRVDKICSALAKKLNGNRYYGLGQLKLRSVRRFTPLTEYPGKLMVFDASDFNMPYDPKISVPANRKKS